MAKKKPENTLKTNPYNLLKEPRHHGHNLRKRIRCTTVILEAESHSPHNNTKPSFLREKNKRTFETSGDAGNSK